MPPARLARRLAPDLLGNLDAGVGVVYYLLLALRRTVADLVSLDGNPVAGLSSVLPTPTDGVVLECKPERSRDS